MSHTCFSLHKTFGFIEYYEVLVSHAGFLRSRVFSSRMAGIEGLGFRAGVADKIQRLGSSSCLGQSACFCSCWPPVLLQELEPDTLT